jgi:alpha-beta hydrolase superfamily lysophospholipase
MPRSYEFLAASMTKLGLAVFSLDHQGHGASEGDRCFVERFRHYVGARSAARSRAPLRRSGCRNR